MTEQKQLTSSTQAKELLAEQLHTWALAEKNYKALETVKIKSFDMDGFTIRVQFNPARIVSTGAKIDAKSIKARKCFLCPANLPEEQLRIPFGNDYQLLCNPFPIFKEHFTIPTCAHTMQFIIPQLDAFMDLTKCLSPLTVFYNGPKSGASAPDHAHFQAVTRGVMPMDEDIQKLVFGSLESKTPIKEGDHIHLLTNYLRNGFVIQSTTAKSAAELFKKIYTELPIQEGETEPMMNAFGSYYNNLWIVTLIPRKSHRPWQYFAEGDDKLMSSPGAADIGGLFITPVEKDFQKINPELIKDVYEQVCLSDKEVHEIFVHLSSF